VVRIVVTATVDTSNQAAFEAAFAEVSSKVRGTSGHIADELLHDPERPENYILLGLWVSREAFVAWEDDPVHRATTTPMRPFWTNVDRRIYEVAVRADGP
jgi:heme-degrading monooxygenase HmoA